MKLFAYFAIFFAQLTFSAGKEIKLLMIDTDAGADDAAAIFNVLGQEELVKDVKVELITIVHGNTNVDNVGRNVLKILKTANRLDIPIYKGLNESLLIAHKTDDFFGTDGFGDFPFPDLPSESLIQNKHAVNALVEAVTLKPGELSLLCLGPLTNIALAIKMYPSFLNNLKDIFILGGSDSGIGNTQPGVEFNFFIDPDSAFIVFQSAMTSGKTLNLVTWETGYERTIIDLGWRKNVLGVVKSPQVELINKAEAKVLNGSVWTAADSFASSAFLDNSIIEASATYSAKIEVCGSFSKGVLLIDYSNIENVFNNVKIIQKINVEKLKKMLLKNLSSEAVAKNA